MPASPPRPVSSVARRVYIAVAALAAATLLAAASPVPIVGPDTAAACQTGSGACGG